MIQEIRGWSRLLSQFAAAQLATQLIAAVTGLLLVRHMSVREFGLYALALSAMGFTNVISDSGITGAMLYFYRDCLRLRRSYGPYVAAALRMRRYLLLAAWLATALYIFSTGSGVGYEWQELAPAILFLYAATWNQTNSAIGMALLRLKQRFGSSYMADLRGSASRMIAVAALAWSSTLQAWTALAASALGAWITRRRSSQGIVDITSSGEHESPVNTDIERRIVRYIAPTLPGTLYFALQAPLVMWLCGHFGDASVIARVGAAGRLGAILALVSGFISNVLVPRLAGITDDAEYLRRYGLGWGVMAATGTAIFAAAALLPHWFVLLLGSSYRDLEDLVPIVALTAIATTWSGYATAIKHARGWVRNQPVAIVALVAVQIALIRSMDLSNVRGALLFQLYSALALLGIELANNLLGFRRSPLVALQTK